MAIIDLATENFQAEITKSDKPVLVDFWAVCTQIKRQGFLKKILTEISIAVIVIVRE